jgi:hypothetical protein
LSRDLMQLNPARKGKGGSLQVLERRLFQQPDKDCLGLRNHSFMMVL